MVDTPDPDEGFAGHPLALARAAEEAARITQFSLPRPDEIAEWPDSWTRINAKQYQRLEHVDLSQFSHDGPEVVPQILYRRRSIREFSSDPVSLSTVASICSSALRAVEIQDSQEEVRWVKPYPSAGSRWAIETYIACLSVTGIARGLFHYDPLSHRLAKLSDTDPWPAVERALGGEEALSEPAFVMILTSVFPRTWVKYGARGSRYAHMEAGAAAMGATLAAQEAGLVGVWLGGFIDDEIGALIDVNWHQELELPVLLLPFGYPVQ